MYSSTPLPRSDKYSRLSMGLPTRPIGPFTACHHPTTVLLVKIVMIPLRSAMN